jgi:beta-glucanase (GH16 family)
MMRMTVLVLATLFLVGCGGGTMPFAPPHNAGDVADGRRPASSSPVGHTTVGPSSFTFGGYTWQTHAWNAPSVGNKNGNVGTFVKSNVSIGSELVLTLKQVRSGSTIYSYGAEVGTTHAFQYGTFEFTSRVVNVYSGSVASGFLYATNSITEIDMEQVGNKPNAVDCTNWKGLSNYQDTEVTGYNQANTHNFKIVWRSTYVDWYVDGKLVVHHTRAVPTTAAPFLFNFWGTNSSTWGGTATTGITRYMYISNFKYTP